MVNGVHYINGPTTKRPTAATSDALNCLRQEAAGDRDKNTLICFQPGPSLKVCLVSWTMSGKERAEIFGVKLSERRRAILRAIAQAQIAINQQSSGQLLLQSLSNCSIVQHSVAVCAENYTKLICSFWGLHGLIYEMWHDFESVETVVDSIRLLLRPHWKATSSLLQVKSQESRSLRSKRLKI